MMKYFALLMLLILAGCGSYGQAIAEPIPDYGPEPVEDTAIIEPAEPIETIIPEEPEAPELSDPVPQEKENPAGITITAFLNSPQGMTKVIVSDGEVEEQYVFSTTNPDSIIQRTAARLGSEPDEVAALIIFDGEGQQSHARA